MGGGPCMLKHILDGGRAAQRSFECMANTALIVATVTDGKPPITPEMEAGFMAAAEAWAKACANLEAELSPYLPPS